VDRWLRLSEGRLLETGFPTPDRSSYTCLLGGRRRMCSAWYGPLFPYPFSAPSVVLMMRRWKMKNSTATGTDISTAAASCTGYWLPAPS
jgi:hypothetical protein